MPMGDYRKRLQQTNGKEICCSVKCRGALYAVTHASPCPECGRPALNRRGKKFCSPECFTAARSRRPVYANAAKVRASKTCRWCGAHFTPKTLRQPTCSRECAAAEHAQRMTGAANPKFKNGRSYSKAFDVARLAAFKRDNWKCLACGAPAVIGHHMDEDVTNNAMENIASLCRTCHATHHKSDKTPWPWLSKARKPPTSSTSK